MTCSLGGVEMIGHRPSEFENVLAMLVNKMVLPERRSLKSVKSGRPRYEKGQVVFLIGAGCSRQYGFPTFRELLVYIWQDYFRSLPDPSWSLEMLRDELDKSWRWQGPEAREEILRFYLDRVSGETCFGYLRLAELAKEGYVKAIVNMNFDALLDQALEKKGCDFKVATEFGDFGYDGLMIYKPHGSLGNVHFGAKGKRPKNELILDIANSDMFADPDEQRFAQKLLTGYDVVTIGYSGIDAKMAAALRGLPDQDPRDRKLFFVNLSPADPRLLLVMSERSSQNLSITGEDASFENFLDVLMTSVERAASGQPVFDTRSRNRFEPVRSELSNLMTRSEREALSNCLRLALSIRSAINVADRSVVSIEEHGREVYEYCIKIANITGNCLTSPEKFLLHCAALLHDLGYFAGFTGGAVIGGLELLRRHGEKTVELIRQRLKDGTDPLIVPSSYAEGSRERFMDMLLDLCRTHAASVLPASKHIADTRIEISGIDVPVRFRLIQAIFATAEHLVKEHPFQPSSDPVVWHDESRFAIDDPVLDLYLRRKKDEVAFDLQKGVIIGRVSGLGREGRPSKAAIWLISMANRFIENLDRVSLLYQGWGVRFACGAMADHLGEKPSNRDPFFSRLLVSALEEDLGESLDVLERDSMRQVVGLLDKAGARVNEVRRLMDIEAPDPSTRTPPDQRKEYLRLTLLEVREWTQFISRTLREDWVTDAESGLQQIRGTLDRLRPQLTGEISRELESARDSAERLLAYLKKNATPLDTVGSFMNSISLALYLLQSIRTGHEKELESTPKGQAKTEIVAAIDHLIQFRRSAAPYSMGEVASILDLVSIYTHGGSGLRERSDRVKGERRPVQEPRVKIDSPPVTKALKWVSDARRISHQGLLHLYLPLKQEAGRRAPDAGHCGGMEKAFLESFEEIIFPAWRFFARNWHGRSEAVLMARACLDLGSSRFRPEVADGLKYLLRDKVDWGSCKNEKGICDTAYGHDECTICSSRLLYIFSYARRLFPQEEVAKLSSSRNGKSLDQAVQGILNGFLARSSTDPAWWGLKCPGKFGSSVKSPDYLAWAACAVAFCLAVDQEHRETVGEEWLEDRCGLDKKKLYDLLGERWDALFQVSFDELLTDQSEEPHSYTLGSVALAYLDLLRLGDPVKEVVLKDRAKKVSGFIEALGRAHDKVSNPSLAQMSQFSLLPVMIVLDGNLTQDQEKEKEESARKLVALCERCRGSRIWIRSGDDQGSWGFNVKNSQALVTGLAAFWRHAFEKEHKERFQRAFEEIETSISPTMPPPAPPPIDPPPAPPVRQRSRRRSHLA